MKKVIITAREEDFEKIKPMVIDMFFSLDKKDDLVKITVFPSDKELDGLITKIEKIIDFRYKESMIEVYTPDFIVSSVLKRAEKKVSISKEKIKEKTPVEKLLDSTKPHLGLDISKIALTSIAGIIALIGLFMNNMAVIIGAMLLSPLIGPIYAFAINTAVGIEENAFRGIRNLIVLLLAVMVLSYIITLLASFFTELSLTPEILARMSSSTVYIFMALLLGFASILALCKGIPEVVAGVAIAAALLPPAVTTGISFVLYPSSAVSSMILTFENVLGLMAGSLFATLILNIGPRRYYEKVVARRFIIRISLFLVALLALLFISSLLL